MSIIICIAVTLCTASTLSADHGFLKFGCERIKDGTIFDSEGEVLETGYNIWGYNYQSRIFVGGYCEAYKNAEWCQDSANIILYMKWNDAWLSNKDCDGDGALDRHHGYDTYIGSGAKITNFQKGYYLDDDNQVQRWSYYTKIIAAPMTGYLEDSHWYNRRGKLLGPSIWDEFYVKEEVFQDTGKTSSEPADSGDTSQTTMRMAAEQARPVPYLDPFSVDFDQFTPMD